MHVLLIEDDPSLGVFYTRALKRAGYEVTIERRGDDGLRNALLHPYDLLILDCYLPGMDGIAILRELRAQGSEVPALVVSGVNESVRQAALEAGASAFLMKPCGLDELTNCVAIMTSRSLTYHLSACAA